MVYIFYSKFSAKLSSESYNYFLQQLPFFIQKKISNFRKWQDAYRSLLGNIILIKGLTFLELNLYSLSNLKYAEYQRPYLDDLIDFNISHSGEYIICAISETNKVGIDIEEICNIQISDINDQFSDHEWERILLADNSLHAFYKFWTQKEAFLKGIGFGLNIPINELNVLNNTVTWDGKRWFLHEIKLDEKYSSYLSTNIPLTQIVTQKIDLY
ncbi:MAG: 4'-phosphopantetheinyl transferase superfamily protein [Ginsengibacter sp.]